MSATGQFMDRVRHVSESMPLDWRALDALHMRRLTSDSRAVQAGDTFVAYPGEHRDGRDFIPRAIAAGAASVLWEKSGFVWNKSWRAAQLGVRGLRYQAGNIASGVYGRPGSRLWTVGVTGTNGKTSCSQWISQSLNRLQRKCAVAGTLGNGFPGALEAGINTTPDPVWFQGRLRDWERKGARAIAMEVSSHGLDQGRLSGMQFDVALLTNLTRDHLDYHGTMQRYRAAKARLFEWESLKWSVLNLDDAFGRTLASRRFSAVTSVLGYGFSVQASPAHVGRVRGYNLRAGLNGVSFDVSTPWGSAKVRSRVLGRFNASNLLGTLSVLLASGAGLRESVQAIGELTPVPGRVERQGGGTEPLIVVDYAHTPDALEKILAAMRGLMDRKNRRRLFCVFGCGGDRDRGKRAIMGRVAVRCADQVIVTSDNPRSEDPMAIIAEILEGAGSDKKRGCLVVADRRRAIQAVVRMARRGDIVVVAGKGHENYQEVAGVRHPYSDAEAVRAALKERHA